MATPECRCRTFSDHEQLGEPWHAEAALPGQCWQLVAERCAGGKTAAMSRAMCSGLALVRLAAVTVPPRQAGVGSGGVAQFEGIGCDVDVELQTEHPRKAGRGGQRRLMVGSDWASGRTAATTEPGGATSMARS